MILLFDQRWLTYDEAAWFNVVFVESGPCRLFLNVIAMKGAKPISGSILRLCPSNLARFALRLRHSHATKFAGPYQFNWEIATPCQGTHVQYSIVKHRFYVATNVKRTGTCLASLCGPFLVPHSLCNQQAPTPSLIKHRRKSGPPYRRTTPNRSAAL